MVRRTAGNRELGSRRLGAWGEALGARHDAAGRRGEVATDRDLVVRCDGLDPWPDHGSTARVVRFDSRSESRDPVATAAFATDLAIDAGAPGGLVPGPLLAGAQACREAPPRAVFEAFAAATGNPWAALLAALGSGASAEARPDLHYHFWLSETVRRWLPEWADDATAARGLELRQMRRDLQDAITLGINLRNRSEAEYLAAIAAAWRERLVELDGVRASVMLVAAALTFAGSRLLRAFRVAAFGPGPTATVAALMGFLAGGFLGLTRLAPLELEGVGLESELTATEGRLRARFGDAAVDAMEGGTRGPAGTGGGS